MGSSTYIQPSRLHGLDTHWSKGGKPNSKDITVPQSRFPASSAFLIALAPHIPELRGCFPQSSVSRLISVCHGQFLNQIPGNSSAG